MASSNRFEYLDSIRGFAIILMVMGHAIAWNYSDWQSVVLFNSMQNNAEKYGGIIWQIIYSFHMALFFMVSGFLAINSGKKTFAEFFANKIKRLFVPWVCSFLIIYLVRGSMGYWFLLSLFQLSLIGFLLIRAIDKLKIKSLSITLFVFVALWIAAKQIPNCELFGIEIMKFKEYLLPFCFGISLRKFDNLNNLVSSKHWIFSLCFILFSVIFVSRYFFENPKGGAFLPLLGSICVWHFFCNLKQSKVANVFQFLGKNTMPIYILHILFVIQIPAIGQFILKQNAVTSITIQLTYSLMISAIAIFWSLVLYKFLRKSKFISFCLFGE